MFVGRVICIVTILLILMMITQTSYGQQNTSINATQEIEKLKRQIAQLQTEKRKLEIENERLKNELQNYKKWDARKLMGKLFIFHLTPVGAKYELLFHEGGLGGVAVYQYVGPWMGDAGKYRQYKQIAQFKTTQLQYGYLKPGIELKPVWGFNNTTITIRSLGDLLRIEREMNSIDGLAKYVDWLRLKYLEASKFNTGVLITTILITMAVGMVIGEIVTPITILSERVTTSAFTDWGERKPVTKTPILILIYLSVCIGLVVILPVVIAAILIVVITVSILLFYKVSGVW